MLEPAMLHKEAIINGLKKHIYEDEMQFYSGWNGCTLPEISDEFDGCNYQYAILDNNVVIGYFCFTYELYSKCLRNFGLYSFDRGNSVIGKDVLYEIRRIIKEYEPHRMEWRMIGGNPVERHYDRFCKRYHGKKLVLTDAIKDRCGKYHDDIIYEIIFDRRKTTMEREYIERNAALEEALNNSAVRVGLADETDIKEIISDIPSADVVSVREYQGLADENRELKRLLRIAIADFESVTKICDETQCESCPNNYLRNYPCEWQYRDEAMKLLKGENVQSFADVQPVIHSKWEISSDGYYPYCKKCNARPENGKMTKYCPNCGAKMDGD